MRRLPFQVVLARKRNQLGRLSRGSHGGIRFQRDDEFVVALLDRQRHIDPVGIRRNRQGVPCLLCPMAVTMRGTIKVTMPCRGEKLVSNSKPGRSAILSRNCKHLGMQVDDQRSQFPRHPRATRNDASAALTVWYRRRRAYRSSSMRFFSEGELRTRVALKRSGAD
jgi:hypothetical protein